MKLFIIVIALLSIVTVACNSNSTTAPATDTLAATGGVNRTDMPEKNKATALAVQQALNNHDVDAVFKDAATGMMDYGDGSMPPVTGLDSCKIAMKSFLTAFPDLKGENFMALAEGNHVAIFGDWSGTFKEEMMGLKPTGKTFKVKDVDMFTFNDEGKITEHRSVQSSETMMAQLGISMKK